jgi:hypothetical protein
MVYWGFLALVFIVSVGVGAVVAKRKKEPR